MNAHDDIPPADASPAGASPGDAYLWDRTDPVDPEVERLEGLMQPLAHRPRALPLPVSREGRWVRHSPAARLGTLAGAAVLLLAVTGVWTWYRLAPRDLELRVQETGRRLAQGSEFVATERERRLLLEEIGSFVLDPGSRLRVQRVKSDRTSLYLEAGKLDAFVAADARPRFLQVETPAATCIDLGCHYLLQVDAATGDAFVEVTTGRVAFQNGNREVYVPADAVCVARKTTGVGTPYFPDSPEELRDALADYDAAIGDRGVNAGRVMLVASTKHDALPVWHFLQADDPELVKEAVATLARIDPSLPGITGVRGVPTHAQRDEWKRQLFGYW